MILAARAGRTCHTSLSLQASPVTPLFAALTAIVQMPENITTLSPVFATLTRCVTPNSFICHSYKKHPGGGVSTCVKRNTSFPPSRRVFLFSANPLLTLRLCVIFFLFSPHAVPITHTNPRNLFPLNRLLHDSLDAPGVGVPLPTIAALPLLCHNRRSYQRRNLSQRSTARISANP
jgi:hypothetical protein